MHANPVAPTVVQYERFIRVFEVCSNHALASILRFVDKVVINDWTV